MNPSDPVPPFDQWDYPIVSPTLPVEGNEPGDDGFIPELGGVRVHLDLKKFACANFIDILVEGVAVKYNDDDIDSGNITDALTFGIKPIGDARISIDGLVSSLYLLT